MKITVVTNGHPREMELAANATFGHVAARAYHETGQTVPVISNWELRDTEGFLLPDDGLLASRVKDGATLYLNPAAGAGG